MPNKSDVHARVSKGWCPGVGNRRHLGGGGVLFRAALAFIGVLAPSIVLADMFLAPSFYTAARPWDSPLFDANRDGLLDILVTQMHVDSATVFHNVGEGELVRAWSVRAGESPAGAIAEDLNGDTFDDIAIACIHDTLAILLSQSGGGFSHTKYRIEGRVVGVASGDFDNDQVPDLVLAGSDYGVVWIYTNDGDGGFAYWTSYSRGGSIQTVAPGDFNRDGFLDVAASNTWTSDLLVVLGDGVSLSPTTATAPDAQTGVVTADFDGDGFLDIVAAGYYHNSIFVLRGRGDGTFDPPAEAWLPGYAYRLVVADFDLDEHPDLAVSSDGKVLILLGNGDCTFAAPLEVQLPFPNDYALARAGDLDGNGSPDLVVCQTFSNTIAVFLNTLGSVTGVRDEPSNIDGAVALRASVKPNPAIGRFSVAVQLPEPGLARLDLLDVQGRLIETQVLGPFGAGRQTVSIGSGFRLRPGIYLIRLTHGNRSVTTRACLIE